MHSLYQHGPSLLPTTRSGNRQLLPSKQEWKHDQGYTGGCVGNLWLPPFTWSGRAFLNPHGFGQIHTNCPSKELRFVLKGLKTQLLKLLGWVIQLSICFWYIWDMLVICSPLPLCRHKAAGGLQGISLEPLHTSFLSIPAKTWTTKSNSGFRGLWNYKET